MGKLVITEFMTLDGVAQAPGGRQEDQEEGFPYGGWQGPLMEPEQGEAAIEGASKMDAKPWPSNTPQPATGPRPRRRIPSPSY